MVIWKCCCRMGRVDCLFLNMLWYRVGSWWVRIRWLLLLLLGNLVVGICFDVLVGILLVVELVVVVCLVVWKCINSWW